MSLYRTYRPTIFRDVVGQQHIVKTLENAVLQDKLSHAYLFAGSRGTGKTSMARILAKSLGSGNAINVVQATVAGLRSLRHPEEVIAQRKAGLS